MIPQHIISQYQKYVRAVNYIAAIQIYLQDNTLLEQPLLASHLKPRLLGHWGTCPGINLVHGALQYAARKFHQKNLYIVGPGHGFPAVQANAFVEGSLVKYDEKATRNEAGLSYITKYFSWPLGFQSHSNPSTPGVILEGGELGYALSTAYGSVLDNPELLSVCLIGDGEAETGPTAAAWHINKLVNHPSNGTVLPILHLNGYKISGPTLFARMGDSALLNFFEASGYQPILVNYSEQIFEDMLEAMDRCHALIEAERKNHKDGIPLRYPMIILRTPKGWTGIKEIDGVAIEGNAPSHQVPGKDSIDNPATLKAVEKWFKSYRFEELFDPKKGFVQDIMDFMPSEDLRPGNSPYANPESQSLTLPDLSVALEEMNFHGEVGSSSMMRAGIYLREVFKANNSQKNFMLFSPDETYSNKLHSVFEVTQRAFQGRPEEHDKDLSPTGRVIEMLSEHSLQGMMQGYTLTGRHGVFASYEAFIQIVSSMADQYIKFLKVARDIPWRKDVPSFNYILTSSGWRQEHNGFSHQNPGFIDDMLNRQYALVRLFFPYDATSTLVCLEHCLASKNGVNIITAGKTLEPRWQTLEASREALKQGLAKWEFVSDDDPEIVLVGIGDYVTKEVLAAIEILKAELPDVALRFVNVLELSIFLEDNPTQFNQAKFDRYFTSDKPLIFSFHGYPQTLKQLIFDFIKSPDRVVVKGYVEEGSTTTPFDMHVINKTSRYHIVMDAAGKLIGRENDTRIEALIEKCQVMLSDHRAYILKHGEDPDELTNWTWSKS